MRLTKRTAWLVATCLALAGIIGAVVVGGAVKGAADEAEEAAVKAEHATEQVVDFAASLRESSVRGCQRQNRVRKRQHEVQNILRDVLQDDIREQRHPDPAILELLGLTQEDVEGVSVKKIKRLQRHRQELNHKLALAPCERLYPKPTGPTPDRAIIDEGD